MQICIQSIFIFNAYNSISIHLKEFVNIKINFVNIKINFANIKINFANIKLLFASTFYIGWMTTNSSENVPAPVALTPLHL